MKTLPITLYGLTVILLVGLASRGTAQDNEEAVRAVQQAMMRSSAQQMQKNTMNQMMSSVWNDSSANPQVMDWLGQDDFRAGVGVSREQVQRIQSTMQNVGDNLPNEPALQSYHQELRNFMEETQGGPFAPNATEATQARFFELQANLHTKAQSIALEKLQYAINENLTPDQLKRVKEFQISIMSENPMVSPGMFEALDLSVAQKSQLDDIKKDMEPAFRKNIDRMADTQWNLQKKVLDKARENGINLEEMTDSTEKKKIMDDLVKNVLESDPMFHQQMRETMEGGKEIAGKLRSRMIDMLSDEQRKRMTDLIDNPPDYVIKMTGRLRNEADHGDQWRPGPDSWKPGDGIPAEYLKHQEERRFPRR